MRKVAAGLFSSIDGVVEAPNEWQPSFDEEMGAVLSRMLEEQDAVLLGRVTFTEWAGYWPNSTDEPFASWINSTPKYVASSTLDSVDQWSNTTLMKGSVAEFVAELRQQDGGTIGTACWRRPQAALPRGHRADQVRTGRRPADQQRCPDRDLPPDPVADQQQVRLRL